MRHYLLAVVVVGLAPVGAAFAENGIWDDIELTGYGQPELQFEALEKVGGFGEILVASPTPLAKRSRILTGFEYEEYVYKNAPSQLYQSYIFADGNTKVAENWRVAYVLKEIHRYEGEDKTSKGQPMLNLELMPRYEKWVNEAFNYALEVGYEKTTGLEEKTRYQVTPEANFTFGKHFVHLNVEMGYWQEENASFYETEPLYVYRLNDWINLGAKALYHKDNNDFAWTEKAIKPLIQFRFDNQVYLELRYERGETEIHDGSGYAYDNYALYTQIPVNDTISVLADVAYRDHRQQNGNQYTWGDKKGAFAKVGLIWTF
ncbi:hypothetical protein [Vibrio tapetis]|uniref:Putative exported protein n=1 Tax=Vibrio tapetis subsp. tapetis TaxID=1671868 RepID=A0A2N8ZMS7_9VIBR|nr:hypothetical protein [Vibrio tapetis]SON53220.1 putative exported protein [Vibrio tapetis subsp. tapetis]